jgi:hypothetical protein
MMAATAPAEKPLLILALMHDYAARDWVDSGVLAELSEQFRFAFISSDRLTIDLEPYGPIVAMHEMPGWRLRLYWLASGLRHLVVKKPFELTHRILLRQATFGMGPKMSRLLNVIARLGIAGPLSRPFLALMRATAPVLIPRDLSPIGVLAYTSVRSYFIDDVIRDARRMGVPVLAITNNWDNLNTKSFLEPPPYLGVWGEQGFLIARLMHRLPAHRIFVTGAPRFEIYRKPLPDRAGARARLGLPLDCRAVLFCGSGVAFEETSLLRELDGAIEDGRLPSDVVILYKPHPLRFKRQKEDAYEPADFKHVLSVPAYNRNLTELQAYPDLLSAADAIISPFSTTVMEGARFGLPALCIGYDDPAHSNYDWNRAAFNLHIYLIRHGDWAVICESRESFLPSCARLIASIGDPAVASEARAAAEMAWRTGSASVASRIEAAVRALANGGHADNSNRASQDRPTLSSQHLMPLSSKD